MMNRQERRAARAEGRRMCNISKGVIRKEHRSGEILLCYACDAAHTSFGVALIEAPGVEAIAVPLCERCAASRDDTAIIRKYWDTPDMVCKDGGELTGEHSQAVYEKLRAGATEHWTMKRKCAFKGCHATTETPYADGWARICGPGDRVSRTDCIARLMLTRLTRCL